MDQEPLRILSVNPGTRYLGIAVFRGPELLDWGVKVVMGKTPREKQQAALAALADLIRQYEPDALALKRLHKSRSSPALDRLVEQIGELARRKRIRIRRYSIQVLKQSLCGQSKLNKRKLAEVLTLMYPALAFDLKKEERNKNPYRVRMFEAVALGAVCYQQLENNKYH